MPSLPTDRESDGPSNGSADDNMSSFRAAMASNFSDFRGPKGADIIRRCAPFMEWQRACVENELWTCSRTLMEAPSTETTVQQEGTTAFQFYGLNFASQDYLGLSSDDRIKEAAFRAIRDMGVHSAGSSALMGNTKYSQELERNLAEATEYASITLYPTGWAAGFGVINGLLTPDDHIVMDRLSHASLQSGAYSTTMKIHRTDHLDNSQVEANLKAIRAEDAHNGILVITESLFSMDSDCTDLRALQDLCRTYGAVLLVDAAHDFGSMAPGGRGNLEIQDLIGDIDIFMVCFSKSFCSNGGFIACNQPHVRQYLKFYSSPQTFSNALSPIQAAVVNRALDIVTSSDGQARRAAVRENAIRLRSQLAIHGIECHGDPSPLVPVKIGDEALARVATLQLTHHGIIANLVEYPAVAAGAARLRIQLQPQHTAEQIDRLANTIAQSIEEARGMLGLENGG